MSEWIKLQIDALRSIVVADDPPPVPPDGIAETREGEARYPAFPKRHRQLIAGSQGGGKILRKH